jgi:glucose uptake protein
MILPQSYSSVLFLMMLSLFCLGSWAAAFKVYKDWRFELFYLDFACGLLMAALIYAFTVGNLGYDGFSFLDDLQHAGKRQWLFVFSAGVIFNLGNMLLMAAISVAGLATAVPMGLGTALLVGTGVALVVRPAINLPLTSVGCLLIFIAVLCAAICYRALAKVRLEAVARAGFSKTTRRPNPMKGIILALIGGALLALFPPLLDKARQGDLGLGPYAVGAIFAFGIFVSTLVFDIFFMNLPVEGEPVEITSYLTCTLTRHLVGVASGAVWFTGVLAALVCTATPEMAQTSTLARILVGQSGPVLAALWGILIFGELKEGDFRVKAVGLLTPLLFLCGVVLIGLAPMMVAKN